MNRRIYRMCLAAVLIIAVAGGVFYYMTLNQKQAGIEKGTFVEKMDDAVLKSERVAEGVLKKTENAARTAAHKTENKVRAAADEMKDLARTAAHRTQSKYRAAEQDKKDLAHTAA